MGIRTWGRILEKETADASASGWEHVGRLEGQTEDPCWLQ